MKGSLMDFYLDEDLMKRLQGNSREYVVVDECQCLTKFLVKFVLSGKGCEANRFLELRPVVGCPTKDHDNKTKISPKRSNPPNHLICMLL
jgi:hypothetical protein